MIIFILKYTYTHKRDITILIILRQHFSIKSNCTVIYTVVDFSHPRILIRTMLSGSSNKKLKRVRTPGTLHWTYQDKITNRLGVLTTKNPWLFSCSLQHWSPSWTSHSSSCQKTSEKVHRGICSSAPFHYVSSKRSCLHQMLWCVAFLLLPGTLIAWEPLLKKTRGKRSQTPQQWPASFTFSLSHLSPISSSGAIRYPHWEAGDWINAVSQAVHQRRATGSFLKDSGGPAAQEAPDAASKPSSNSSLLVGEDLQITSLSSQ